MNEPELDELLADATHGDCGCGSKDLLSSLYDEIEAAESLTEESAGDPDLDALEAELSAVEVESEDEDLEPGFEEAAGGLSLEEELEFAATAEDGTEPDIGLEDILSLVEKYPGLRIGFSFR